VAVDPTKSDTIYAEAGGIQDDFADVPEGYYDPDSELARNNCCLFRSDDRQGAGAQPRSWKHLESGGRDWPDSSDFIPRIRFAGAQSSLRWNVWCGVFEITLAP